jgi:CRP-like cAMP-binding protein
MSPVGNEYANRLLAAFPPEILVRFFSELDRFSVPLRHVFYEAGAPIDEVYFLEDGLACIVTKMENGSSVEVGMIGREGMVGMQALLGDETSAQQIIAQIPGTALRLSVAKCKEAFDQSAAARAAVHRFTSSIINQSAQTAACNRLHAIEQRLSRWLLMASDRAESDIMPMTHEFLSSMLGVRRSGVTDTASALQRSGLIHYRRGQIGIIDRAALEATACECYALERDRFRRLS